MCVLRHMYLVTALAVSVVDTASADSDLARFLGSYNGFGFAEDATGPFINTERDFELAITPVAPDGFKVAWLTVKRKGNDPNNLEAVVSRQSATFLPSATPGIYHGVSNGEPLAGDDLTWARLRGSYLTVYQFVIKSNGVPELHVYRRMLTAKGLELQFTASRDGEQVRTVRGRYRKR